MVLKSLKFAILLFIIMIALDWMLYQEVNWLGILFGTIIASLTYFGFQWQDEKTKR